MIFIPQCQQDPTLNANTGNTIVENIFQKISHLSKNILIIANASVLFQSKVLTDYVRGIT